MALLKIAGFVLFVVFCYGAVVAHVITLPDGRNFTISEPEDYSYFLRNESPVSLERLYVLLEVKSNTALLCPQGYFISEMYQELVINPNTSLALSSEVPKFHKASLLRSFLNTPNKPPCPTLYHCLGYQACLFKFGNEFCGQDPAPTLRKVIILTLVCHSDDQHPHPSNFKSQTDMVLHLHYKSRLDLEPLSLKNYSATKVLRTKIPEFDVFEGNCPPVKVLQGYSGNCSELTITKETIIQRTWSLLGRIHSRECRSKAMQIFCAFQYSPQGLCIPPVFNVQHQRESSRREFSFESLPHPAHHYSMKKYKQFLSEHCESLIPARLGFIILIHKDAAAVIALLHSIYRSQHFYVIHVDSRADDIRTEMNSMLSEGPFPTNNVVVLPNERSFPTSWASYEIVRAELEGFEELLRMGSWDFVINLSGSDLPLRDIDDLALALAPHRGHCFLPFVHMINGVKNSTSDNLEKSAFFACDGYVYNITSTAGLPNKEKIEIYRSPQWGVFSRDFLEYLVDEKARSAVINEFQFFLQTHVVPDESYIPTILMNSPFRKSLHLASIQTSKEFQGTNSDDLCRHFLSDSDFCGQGPGFFTEEDMSTLLSHSHRSFFARKFQTGKIGFIRKYVTELSQTGYYQFFETFLPTTILQVLAELGIFHYASENRIPRKNLHLESVRRIYITPSLVPHDTCCRSSVITGLRKISDYNFWMDLSIEPTISGRYCYPDGHLKMAFISAWMKEKTSDANEPSYGLDQTLPLPYGPAFSSGISVVLLLSNSDENENCKGNFIDKPLIFEDTTKPVAANLELISPDGKLLCSQKEIVFFEAPTNVNETMSDEEESEDELEPLTRTHHFSMRCGKMEPGPWKLQLTQIGSAKARTYNFPFYLLDIYNPDNLEFQLKDVQHLWRIKEFEVLPDEILNFVDEPIENEYYSEQNEVLTEDSREDIINKTISTDGEILSEIQKQFICSVGVISCVTVFIFLYHLLICGTHQIQQKHILCYITVLGIATICQIFIFMLCC